MEQRTDETQHGKEAMSGEEMDLIIRRKEMTRESWIKNVMRIYPAKTREETEDLWQKLFDQENNSVTP